MKLHVSRSLISPKPGSTPVSAWSRSASRCSSTSSTSSEARPRQMSTATLHKQKSRATETPPLWLTDWLITGLKHETDSFIHLVLDCLLRSPCSKIKRNRCLHLWKEEKSSCHVIITHKALLPNPAHFLIFKLFTTSPVPRTCASKRMPVAVWERRADKLQQKIKEKRKNWRHF